MGGTSDEGAASRVVAVLGMHRSGTSWLAGSLQERGLELGKVPEWSRHNLRGNRESSEITRVHTAVLADNGATWLDPPAEVRWSAERSAGLQAVIDDMGRRHRVWGFKDPRTLLLLDEWLRLVPLLEFVGVFRHPLAVYRSLHRRNEFFDEPFSARLWALYNERLVALHQSRSFPLIRFDVAPELLHAQLDQAAIALRLEVRTERDRFYDATLVHHDATDASVLAGCRELWDYLNAQSLAG